MGLKIALLVFAAFLLVLPAGAFANSTSASTSAASAKKTCPTDSLTYADCANTDRASTATEWIGEDGCRYKCKEVAPSSTGTAPSTGTAGTVTSCPTKSTIYEDCSASDRAQTSWYDSSGCLHACKATTTANTSQKYPLPDGSCKNPLVPMECFDGTGQGAALYTDSNGCLKYKCLKGICSFNAKVRITDCGKSDALRPQSDYWWDGEGCFSMCAGTERAAWVNSPIDNLCIDRPDLSFTGYFPNPEFYPEAYRRNSAIQKAAQVQRIEKRCSDDSEVKRYELWLKLTDDQGNMLTYCNFVCRDRKQEQCYLDGTFDTYVDEWCLDSNGNRINPDAADSAATETAPCQQPARPYCADGAEAYSYKDSEGCQHFVCRTGNSNEASYLSLSNGWNMVSLPVNSKLSMEKVAASCNSPKYAWKYGSNGYSKETTLVPGIGYWIKAGTSCKVEFSGSPFTGPLAGLSAGWNLVGATWGGININDYAGTCSITSGPWHYSPSNAADSPYTLSSTLSQGKAYWIKVASACTLDNEAVPPAPPS